MEDARGRRGSGNLIVISGPSGAGKSSIRRRLFELLDGLVYSVSCTTRAPREGEVDGVDYRFVSKEEFEERIRRGDFLEWASVHGNLYGTLKEDVEKALSQGKDVVLEIDVQGARQVKEVFPGAILIFIMPPSREVLERRLADRGTETTESFRLRMESSEVEMRQVAWYDHAVVNDDLERATDEVKRIIESYRA